MIYNTIPPPYFLAKSFFAHNSFSDRLIRRSKNQRKIIRLEKPTPKPHLFESYEKEKVRVIESYEKSGRFTAIQKFCVQCCDGNQYELDKCPHTRCSFYKCRPGHVTSIDEQEDRIREKCYECTEDSPVQCNRNSAPHDTCPLFPYRPRRKYRKQLL